MLLARYIHMSLYFEGRLYVMGGRILGKKEPEALRNDCEYFDFNIE